MSDTRKFKSPDPFCPECDGKGGDSIYGTFHGGDPRDFSPDPECSTEQERENHRLACDEAEKNGTPTAPDCVHGPGIIMTRSQFGLGVNINPCKCEVSP